MKNALSTQARRQRGTEAYLLKMTSLQKKSAVSFRWREQLVKRQGAPSGRLRLQSRDEMTLRPLHRLSKHRRSPLTQIAPSSPVT